jgi:copper resistance protein B
MRRLLLLAVVPAALATGAAAQTSNPHAGHATPPAAPDPHSGHAPDAPDEHAGHAMSGAERSVGDTTAPPPPSDNLADRYYGGAAMADARAVLNEEHGGGRFSKVMSNLLEHQVRPGGDGYRWDVEGWYGGDINRFVFKTEGEGAWRGGVETGEVQGLFSRAIGRYTDFQVGVRHDFEPGPSKTYATVAVETVAPYWFEVEGALFLSEDGDLRGRLEGTYDLRLTQRLVLQPQAELGFAAQDIRDIHIGAGITDAELSLRLRYEIRREFAPYVGVVFERSLGRTADLARAADERVETTSFLVGLRAWF